MLDGMFRRHRRCIPIAASNPRWDGTDTKSPTNPNHLLMKAGPTEALAALRDQPLWILAIGPLFAALAGIGFKEFFCFQRPEAIGLTLLLPAALLGHLVGLINGPLCLALLESAALLLVLLALRKFGMEAAADVGDKSVFAYLDGQLPAGTP